MVKKSLWKNRSYEIKYKKRRLKELLTIKKPSNGRRPYSFIKRIERLKLELEELEK